MTNNIPRATYRLQFTPKFTFKDAYRILPYLKDLGISHVYASPITQARTGSSNGYDVCNPKEVNPELGTYDDLIRLMQAIASLGMGWIQDIVSNHMAYSSENLMLMDVLEHGSASRYFEHFDIDWDHFSDSLNGRVAAPFLGKPLGDCLNAGEVKLIYDKGLAIGYYEYRFPIKPESYLSVLAGDLPALREKLSKQGSDYVRYTGVLYTLRNLPDHNERQERLAQAEMALLVLRELYETNEKLRAHMDRQIGLFNGDAKDPEKITNLYRLLSTQHYRLCFWRVAAEEINYRRFFTISDLIAIRVEHEFVFNNTHQLFFDLYSKGLLHGLRVDHIDGLFDPAGYLERLRLKFPNAYILVEKILEKHEHIPPSWPIQGETGYQFLNFLNGIFCASHNALAFDELYNNFNEYRIRANDLKIDRKRLIITKHMAGDIDNVVRLILENADTDMIGADVTFPSLRAAMVEVLAHFPIYRTYVDGTHFDSYSKKILRKILQAAQRARPEFEYEFRFIESFLMLSNKTMTLSKTERNARRRAIMRFQQFTGPLMAKGYEDTFLYIYNRLVSLNEVGGWPVSFGNSLDEYHNYIVNRKEGRPYALNATATHDTKRGEDNRTRLAVLSEIPDEWKKTVSEWKGMNSRHKRRLAGSLAPDLNDEYLLYQTLVGSHPVGQKTDEKYLNRLKEYMLKAIREAKVHTAWIKPDAKYENAAMDFIDKVMSSKNHSFLVWMQNFINKIAWFGRLNSMTQALVKSTTSGVPDYYQGTELWDYSLVDPDNRREVNFGMRAEMLQMAPKALREPDEEYLDRLLASPESGQIKQYIISRALQFRQVKSDLYLHGQYISLTCKGQWAQHVVAFAVQTERDRAIAVAPRWCTSLTAKDHYPVGRQVWDDTVLVIPGMAPQTLKDLMTGSHVTVGTTTAIADILANFPVALLGTDES